MKLTLVTFKPEFSYFTWDLGQFFKKDLLILCMWMFYLHVCLCTVCMPGASGSTRRARVSDTLEPELPVGARTWMWVLIMVEPSLQSLYFFIITFMYPFICGFTRLHPCGVTDQFVGVSFLIHRVDSRDGAQVTGLVAGIFSCQVISLTLNSLTFCDAWWAMVILFKLKYI